MDFYAIPKGEARTTVELRNVPAALWNAETASPSQNIKYWKWLACAACEIEDTDSAYADSR